ncbi:MAG TPA: hypothetical protein VFA44_14020 [Gaiellaceae bacterium]|nr:hypothetical protein [Gaiellaceae bacterium]
MAGYGLFVGFGFPVRGREQKAAAVFGEAVELWTRYQQEGKLEAWEAIFLEPHGGDLGGFFLLRGDGARELAGDEAFQRLVTRAQLIVDNFGVVGVQMGDRIGEQMQRFLEAAAELA